MPSASHPDAPYGEGRHTQPQSEPKSLPQRSGVTLYAMQGRECGQVGMPVNCPSRQVPSARLQVRIGDTRTASDKPSEQPAALSQTAKLNVCSGRRRLPNTAQTIRRKQEEKCTASGCHRHGESRAVKSGGRSAICHWGRVGASVSGTA